MNIDNTRILLSSCRALIEAITNNIRAIQVSYDKNSIVLYYYYKSEPKEYETELEDDVAVEIASDFPGIESVIIEPFVLPFPKEIPENGLSIFRIYEGEIY